MKAIRLAVVSLFFLMLFSCKNDSLVEPQPSDYLIFGHFYGECGGDGCIKIFRLEQGRLLEDKRDAYPQSDEFYKGYYVKLSDQKFTIAKDLVDSFPQGLLSVRDRVIGQPDAGDWGGLYIEYNYNGKRQFWLLDQKKQNVPANYHNFIDKVNEKIRQLN